MDAAARVERVDRRLDAGSDLLAERLVGAGHRPDRQDADVGDGRAGRHDGEKDERAGKTGGQAVGQAVGAEHRSSFSGHGAIMPGGGPKENARVGRRGRFAFRRRDQSCL